MYFREGIEVEGEERYGEEAFQNLDKYRKSQAKIFYSLIYEEHLPLRHGKI
jgi:hypothetical protein